MAGSLAEMPFPNEQQQRARTAVAGGGGLPPLGQETAVAEEEAPSVDPNDLEQPAFLRRRLERE